MKKPWWKTLLRALVFLIVSVVTLVALALAWFSFSGRRELARVKSELRTRGEKLSLVELLPPPMPSEENFFADPMWAELTDLVEVDMPGNPGVKMKKPRLSRGKRQLDELSRPLDQAERQVLAAQFPKFSRKEYPAREVFREQQKRSRRDRRAAEFILAATAPAEPILARLTALAERPGAHFPILFPDLAGVSERAHYLIRACQILEWRVWAHLTLGDTPAAQKEVLTMVRLTESLSREPLLISVLVRIAPEIFAVRAIDDGLRAQLWTDPDLAAFEKALAPIEILPSVSLALRGERGNFNQGMESIRQNKLNPFPGWYLWAFGASLQALNNRLMQGWIDAIDQSVKTGYSPSRTISMKPVEDLKKNPWTRVIYLPATLLPNMTNIATQSALLQNRVNQTRAACALERYRLAHDAYPENLADLVPEFLPAVPPDVIDRQPLRYRRETPERFVLWSVGENEVDDHGSGKDWVWGTED